MGRHNGNYGNGMPSLDKDRGTWLGGIANKFGEYVFDDVKSAFPERACNRKRERIMLNPEIFLVGYQSPLLHRIFDWLWDRRIECFAVHCVGGLIGALCCGTFL